MGKCVSKDQHLQHIREIDERAYIAISDEFEYYHYEVSVNFRKVFAKIMKHFNGGGTGCSQKVSLNRFKGRKCS